MYILLSEPDKNGGTHFISTDAKCILNVGNDLLDALLLLFTFRIWYYYSFTPRYYVIDFSYVRLSARWYSYLLYPFFPFLFVLVISRYHLKSIGCT